MERANAYLATLNEALSDELLASLCFHLQQQRVLGHDTFGTMVEAQTRHLAGVRPAHRRAGTGRSTDK
ncbi:hypothetical protein Xcom_19115 [Xanthomonas axonopodis pv. commiphoreae]|nr:hypothetical protein Xcom_19115 [Xanthomonas axonopodis pv. commiphoreae]